MIFSRSKWKQLYFFILFFLAFDFCQFCVVIRGFSSPPQRPKTSDFEGFLYQILSIPLFSYNNCSESFVKVRYYSTHIFLIILFHLRLRFVRYLCGPLLSCFNPIPSSTCFINYGRRMKLMFAFTGSA